MADFDLFVILAEMRTGSNFLERNLQQFDGLNCYGEAFNPHFIGAPKWTDILGVDQETRDANPGALLTAIRNAPGKINGFRYFHDHDPRVFDMVLSDPRCAKVVLTRNPVESYVSLKIAQATDQWQLRDAKARKATVTEFDAAEFAEHIEQLQAFQIRVLNRLQISGQSAFYVAYEDLQSVDVMNGIAAYLGLDDRLDGLDKTLKKQNPAPLSEKVSNFDEMQAALSHVDLFNLGRTPNFEPRRGPAIPTWITGAKTPLVYMPIRGPLADRVTTWMAQLDDVPVDALGQPGSQKALRKWLRAHVDHRSFTVVQHPLERAHDVYCRHILSTGAGSFPAIRRVLRNRYKLPLPKDGPDGAYDAQAHHKAFAAFLEFLKANLAEQTTIRVDPAWASQAQIVQGFSEFLPPDRILRANDLERDLTALGAELGARADVNPAPQTSDWPFALSEIYSDELERRARDAYPRDYLLFGFKDWSDQAA